MEEFTKGDPAMRTLCNCGVNRASFHFSCLVQWMGGRVDGQAPCPSCRAPLFYEEHSLSTTAIQGDVHSNDNSSSSNN
ncbi:unnamed protein product, partial [Discosporangium mesarthrocarpum]